MHIIWTILVGFIVGLIARGLFPGRNPLGFIRTVLLGIVGAVLAKYLGQGVGWYGPQDNAGFIASVIGAVIVLGVYQAIVRRRAGERAETPERR